MFTTGKDGNLELLTPGAVPKHLASVYGQAPYYPANSSTPVGAYSGMNPYAGPYYLAAMTSRGNPIEATISHPLARTSSSSSGISPDQDSTEDYPEIGGQLLLGPDERGLLNWHGGLTPSGNSCSRYPTIGRSETFDARTPDCDRTTS
jgi:hypothetical protein